MSLLSSPNQNISFIHYTEDEIINDQECKKNRKLITNTYILFYFTLKMHNILLVFSFPNDYVFCGKKIRMFYYFF